MQMSVYLPCLKSLFNNRLVLMVVTTASLRTWNGVLFDAHSVKYTTVEITQRIMNPKNRASIIRVFFYVMGFWILNNFKANAENSLMHKLENRHLLVGATKSPMVKNRELTVVSLGIIEDIVLRILSSYMKFTYEIIPPSDILSPGYLQANGSWTGTAGQLQRKEVDMCASTSAQSAGKLRVLDASYPVIYVDASILIPFPKEETKWVQAYSAFQDQVWLAIAFIFAFTILAAWIIHRITKSNPDMNSQNSLSFWFFYFFSSWTLNQGITLKNESSPFRLACIVSIFGIFIIMNYFTAFYTAVLSIPTFKTIVSSIEDVASNGAINPLIIKGSSTEEYILSSTESTMKKIRDLLLSRPERRILDTFTVADISTVVKDNSVLIVIKPTAQSLIDQSYKINRKCHVTLAEKTFFSRPQIFTYQKNSPLARSFDYNLQYLHQVGLIQYAKKRSAAPHDRCSLSESQKVASNETLSLKLKDLAGAFAVLLLGLLLSVIVLLVEIILKNLKTKCSKLT